MEYNCTYVVVIIIITLLVNLFFLMIPDTTINKEKCKCDVSLIIQIFLFRHLRGTLTWSMNTQNYYQSSIFHGNHIMQNEDQRSMFYEIFTVEKTARPFGNIIYEFLELPDIATLLALCKGI